MVAMTWREWPEAPLPVVLKSVIFIVLLVIGVVAARRI
jgi:hypothetical protein